MENPFWMAPTLPPTANKKTRVKAGQIIRRTKKKVVRRYKKKPTINVRKYDKNLPKVTTHKDLKIQSLKEQLKIHKDVLKEIQKQSRAIHKQQALINKLHRQRSEQIDFIKKLIKITK